MLAWRLNLWSMQYLNAVLIICIYIYRQDSKSLSNRIFFAYGFCLAMWALFVFLHRVAPSAEKSETFFRIGMFFQPPSIALILLVTLSLIQLKTWHLIALLPSLTTSAMFLFVDTFSTYWTRYGWTYQAGGLFEILIIASNLGLTFLILFVLVSLIRRVKQSALRTKLRVLLIAVSAFLGGMAITNFLLWINPDLPSFDGIFTLAEFILIAYALALPMQKIAISPERVEYMGELS